jgi:rhodanese-related sulfurtransferase
MKKLVTFCATVFVAASALAAQYQDITISELKSLMSSKKVTLLDANGTESYQKGHIPGAIDFTANEGQLAKLLPADKNAPVVAYCANPKCNAYQGAAKAAAKLGYKNIKHLTAGIAGWKEAGEPTQVASK